MWTKCHSVRRAFLLHRHRCDITSVLTMYMSRVYKSDHFKIELDTEQNRRDRVFVKRNIHKVQEAVCIQASMGDTVESRDRQACLSCNSKGIVDCISTCRKYLVLGSSS